MGLVSSARNLVGDARGQEWLLAMGGLRGAEAGAGSWKLGPEPLLAPRPGWTEDRRLQTRAARSSGRGGEMGLSPLCLAGSLLFLHSAL